MSVLPGYRRAAVTRGLSFLLLWLLLMPSIKPGNLLIGLLTAVAAVWLSLRLLPPVAGYLHFGRFAALSPHFLWVSILAGVDVARRALDPRLPLRCGLVDCPLGYPPGMARNTFATFTSLMPGTVAIIGDGRILTYHCLDITQPVVEQLWAEERLMAKALLAGRQHD